MLQEGGSLVRLLMRPLAFLNWPSPPSCNIAIASTQPLTEKSTRNLHGVKGRYACKVTTSLPSFELSLSYGRRSVDQFILVSGSLLGPMARFYPFLSDNCFVVLPVGLPLCREDGSITYSAIDNWSGHWGPITIHYRLIWDCVPSQGLRWRYPNSPPHGTCEPTV
jgi:hypothetical protein